MSGAVSLTQQQNAKMLRSRDAERVESAASYALSAAERHELEQTQGVVFNLQRMSMH